MRVLTVLLVVIAALTLLASGAYAAGKTTIDPNTPAASSTADESSEQTDIRLARRITYFSGYTRLSDAVFQISQLSEISISTGRVRSDWQVRDLPVVICANDISVGQLLKLITDTYCLTLSRSDADGVWAYKLYRPKAYEAALDGYAKGWAENPLRNAQFQWQTFSHVGALGPEETEKLYQQVLGKQSDYGIAFSSEPEDFRLAFDEVVLYGKLINSVDDASYARMLDGEEIVLSAEQGGETGKLVSDFARLKQNILRARRRLANSDTGDFLDASDIAHAQLRLRLNPNNGFALEGNLAAGREVLPGFHGDILSFGMAASAAGNKSIAQYLPTAPSEPSLHEMKYLKPIGKDEEMESKGRYEFNKPSTEKLLLADVLTAVSKATGYTIIADDYSDHKDDPGISAKDLFSDRRSLLDVKNALGKDHSWYICSDAKSLAIKHRYWINRYTDLVPKSLFSDWLSKAKTSGLDLDDYLAAWQLTVGQRYDWIDGVADLQGLKIGAVDDARAFQLNVLSSMTKPNRSAARVGVPLANLRTDLFTRYFNSLPADTRPKDDISQLQLRLTREEQPGAQLHTYSMSILGGGTDMKFTLGVSFPIYSPDRGKQVSKDLGTTE